MIYENGQMPVAPTRIGRKSDCEHNHQPGDPKVSLAAHSKDMKHNLAPTASLLTESQIGIGPFIPRTQWRSLA
jgi:hypothetical protein